METSRHRRNHAAFDRIIGALDEPDGAGSRDLTLDSSHLQSVYAEVLCTAFRQTPGVAPVAVEAARAIAAKRDVTGVEQQNRPEAVFIEGEFRTHRHAKDDSPVVAITVRGRDGARVLVERALPVMPLSEAGGRLLALFNTDLAKLASPAGTLIDAEGQYRLLTERADEFSILGEFRRSAALREAALLLKPDADSQRLKLVREYARHNSLGFNILPAATAWERTPKQRQLGWWSSNRSRATGSGPCSTASF